VQTEPDAIVTASASHVHQRARSRKSRPRSLAWRKHCARCVKAGPAAGLLLPGLAATAAKGGSSGNFQQVPPSFEQELKRLETAFIDDDRPVTSKQQTERREGNQFATDEPLPRIARHDRQHLKDEQQAAADLDDPRELSK